MFIQFHTSNPCIERVYTPLSARNVLSRYVVYVPERGFLPHANMPRWCLLPTFSIAFLVQEVLTTATLLDRESSETSSKLVLQARGTNVLDDKYFIPAIATISAFVLLSLVCLYFLGCCCNAKKMDEFHSKADSPSRPVIRSMWHESCV